MYAKFFRFFGLYANPFNDNPDPSYLFLNPRILAVLDDLENAIQEHKRLITLTGEAGTGKTVIINKVRQWLRLQRIPTSFIVNPCLQMNEFVDLIFSDLGISRCGQHKGEPLATLNQWVNDRAKSSISAVLIVDEAQSLPVHILADIPSLLNPVVPFERPLQVILSGQPELTERLRESDLQPVRQLVGLQCETVPLSFEEARQYIRYRIRTAGGIDGTVFAPEAIEAVWRYSQGIPRVMNLLCEHAMIRASLAQTRPVPADVMEMTSMDLGFGDVFIFTGGQQWQEASQRQFMRETAETRSTKTERCLSHLNPLGNHGPNGTGRGECPESTPGANSVQKLRPERHEEEITRTRRVSELKKAKRHIFFTNPRNIIGYKLLQHFWGRDHMFPKWRHFARELAIEMGRVSIPSLTRLRLGSALWEVSTWKRRIASIVAWLNEPFPAPKIDRRPEH